MISGNRRKKGVKYQIKMESAINMGISSNVWNPYCAHGIWLRWMRKLAMFFCPPTLNVNLFYAFNMNYLLNKYTEISLKIMIRILLNLKLKRINYYFLK